MLRIPFEPEIAGLPLNVHLILEYVAFFVAFRYYLFLRKQRQDVISSSNRLSIIIGATAGALICSRVVGILENPLVDWSRLNLWQLYNIKTIMGGLFGGLLGVETAKRIIGERRSSGDLFTLPIVVGIFIGRVGCFLSGIREFTYGAPTTWITGMDLGDGILRHPLALYELAFLLPLFVWLRAWYRRGHLPEGRLFQYFMLSYFGFRFLLEWLKPNVFLWGGLSTIQWLCVICFVYYHKTLTRLVRADPKVHLL